MSSTRSRFTRSLALGLLCALPMFNLTLGAPTLPRDVTSPKAAIAVKLNRKASRARSLAGVEIVEELIRNAQAAFGHAKRDAQFDVLPLIASLTPEKVVEMIQRTTELDPTYEPADFSSWFQVHFPQDNTIDDVGIAPAAQGQLSGSSAPSAGNPPEAIMDAGNFLSPGDVMLLEMQTVDTSFNSWPIEILDAEYEAIRLAVALRITVVEPAGNGGMNMDKPVLRDGDTTARALLNRDSPDFRDSGAIMVGAGTAAVPRSRLGFSNYGSRANGHAWGENIQTTSVTMVKGRGRTGMVNANRGSKLTPTELRSLITVGGSATSNLSSDLISVQPDLTAFVDGGHLQERVSEDGSRPR
ncbi:hypothetical protein N657DRAFT_653192 [Parathielavia appendiculata]|uniref:Uncharacterized protein n=1 Tax=Parathielavia appendiculata TaxID=2587402 RepID=A0AAN6Z6A0_9PEZI|nr:hypothetical protein N657DRAFT_653192 [Parathielavia appendiculata]